MKSAHDANISFCAESGSVMVESVCDTLLLRSLWIRDYQRSGSSSSACLPVGMTLLAVIGVGSVARHSRRTKMLEEQTSDGRSHGC